jgi:hypothetical protein
MTVSVGQGSQAPPPVAFKGRKKDDNTQKALVVGGTTLASTAAGYGLAKWTPLGSKHLLSREERAKFTPEAGQALLTQMDTKIQEAENNKKAGKAKKLKNMRTKAETVIKKYGEDVAKVEAKRSEPNIEQQKLDKDIEKLTKKAVKKLPKEKHIKTVMAIAGGLGLVSSGAYVMTHSSPQKLPIAPATEQV